MTFAWAALAVSTTGLVFMLLTLWRHGDHDRD
jgi:hypothetical protein